MTSQLVRLGEVAVIDMDGVRARLAYSKGQRALFPLDPAAAWDGGSR